MKYVLPVILLFQIVVSNAQSILDSPLNGSVRGQSLMVVIDSLEQKNNVRFYFLPEWIDNVSFPTELNSTTLGAALDEVLNQHELSYVEMYPGSIVIIKDPTLLILRKSAIDVARRDQKKVTQLQFGSPATRKQQVNITGQVIDSKNEGPLAGAAIRFSGSTINTTSGPDGKFSVRLPAGQYVMSIDYLNYEEQLIDLSAYADGYVYSKMEELPTVLEELVVQDQADRVINESRLGQVQLSMADIKRAPMMLGEVDLVKQIQTLAGVTTVGEAASGFNVRGGSVDQNLILYDGMPIFNSSHAFGFLSAFNSHAIRDVSFYRGGIPAEFGGRASSVLDIRSKDGSFEKWGGNAGIGIIASHAMLNGPLKKDKTSIAASIRSTYSDWLIHSVRSTYADLTQSSVSFYDATLKLTHLFSQNTKLSVTGYGSKDSFRLQGDSTYQWFNKAISARLDHRFSEHLSADVTAGVSNYSYNILNSDPLTSFDLSYRILTPSMKAGFHYQGDRHRVTFGTQLQYYDFDPGSLVPGSQSDVEEIHMTKQKSFENAVFINDIFTINEKLSAEGGIRIPVFTSLGTNQVTYSGVEPRVSFRLSTGTTSSVKAGYTRMYQFLHLVSNTAAVTPIDIWQPSGNGFKPQRADQFSLGYFRTFKERKFEASAEAFYKYTSGILDFRNGAKLILNDNLQKDLLRGNATAYGIETSAGIVSGRLTGNVNYTYSRSLRQVAGPTDAESINHGRIYPANFDQPHIVNLSWKYGITRRYFFTGNFTYHTGRPITVPLSGYYFENTTVSNFSERNKFRIPDYHRLDLALVIEGNHKRKKLGDGTWVIGFYNVYARRNAYSVFFKPSAVGPLRSYQMSIVGTILPSISYNFTF